jgi:nitrile hydratase
MNASTPTEPILYANGAAVRIRTGSPAHHFRTPAYIQGHTGTVAALCGVYPNPESLAHGGDGLPRQPLYRIELRQTDLWPDYSGNPADTLQVDVYQHWLEPA